MKKLTTLLLIALFIAPSISYAYTYATWNPSDKDSSLTLSGSDLIATKDVNTGWGSVRSTIGVTSGKWYWEIKATTKSGGSFSNIANATAALNTYLGADANGWGYYSENGSVFHNGSAAYGNTYTTNDVIGVALDMDSGKLWWAKNNTWQNSGNPAAGTGEAFSGITGTIYAGTSLGQNSVFTANFGATALTYSPPSGFNPGLYSGSAPATTNISSIRTVLYNTVSTVRNIATSSVSSYRNIE